MKAIIYTLKDPIDGQIRYIGTTFGKLSRRLVIHYYKCSIHSSSKDLWIRGLKNNNLKPIIEELESLECSTEKEVFIIERTYIELFIGWGFNLTNSVIRDDSKVNRKGLIGNKNPNYGKIYGKAPSAKDAVVQLDLSGNFIKEFSCIQETITKGFSPGIVSRCVNKKRSQHKGYIFINKKDYIKNKKIKFTPKNTQKKPVEQFTIDGEFIREFTSASEAAESISSGKSDSIGRVCRGKRKSYKGYKWAFKTN